MKRTLLTTAFLAVTPTLAAAGQAEPTALFPAIMKVVGSMGIILGLILLFYYLSRKGVTLFPASRSGAIKVVETRYLMPKKAVSLISVRGREFLLGIGTDRVELLTPVNWKSDPSLSFDENLEKSMNRETAGHPENPGAETP